MTALGVNVSDRDPVHGWESIKPETVPDYVMAANRRLHEAEAAWHLIAEEMNDCEDSGDYELFCALRNKLHQAHQEMVQAEFERVCAKVRWQEEKNGVPVVWEINHAHVS